MTSGWQPTSDAVDRGAADPDVRSALAAAYNDDLAYARAVAALCTARLIFPTVEAPPDAEPGRSKAADDAPSDPAPEGHDHHHGQDHDEHPARAAVLLTSATGAKGVLVFTGLDALAAWRPDAHPVRCTLDDVAATVTETGSTSIVVDVAGPHPLVIEGNLVTELAQGRRLAVLPDGGFAWIWRNDMTSTGRDKSSH